MACHRKHFRVVCYWTPSKKKRCYNPQELTRFLSTSVVAASSHALWRVLSNKVIWVSGHCRVDTPHKYKPLSETFCFSKAVCSPRSRSRRVTRNVLIEALLFNSFRQNSPFAYCAHVTVVGIWFVKQVGNHHGQEAGQKCDLDSSRLRNKRTFGSGLLL